MRYEDFAIHFERADGAGLIVRVLDSPAGEGSCFSALDLGGAQELSRKLLDFSANTELAAQIGEQLFRGLFQGQVRELYDQSRGMLTSNSAGGKQSLRLILRLDPTDATLARLYSLPWELLYRPDTREFLALSREFSIVRYLEVPRPARTMPLPFPLRVLVLSSSPKGVDPMDFEQEASALRAAFTSMPGVEVHVLNRANLRELRSKLLSEPFHVVHFIGHASFDGHSGVGAILLENTDRTQAIVTGQALATFLADFVTIRLVVLNACRTAQATTSDRANPFSGVATALVLCGIPAVVAMQFSISDQFAIEFSSAFYSRLATGDPVDAAVAEGRLAIFAQEPGGVEWATPALFLRVPGGNVFAPQRGVAQQVPDLQEAARTAVESEFKVVPIQLAESREGRPMQSNEGVVDTVAVESHTFNFKRAFDGVQESTLFVLREIELAYEQTRAESRRWSQASMIAAGFGLLMIGATLVSILTSRVEMGTISAIGSVITTVISGLFFSQSRSANKRLDLIIEELGIARKTHFAQEIARTMETPSERDKAKLAIVVALLGEPKGRSASNTGGG